MKALIWLGVLLVVVITEAAIVLLPARITMIIVAAETVAMALILVTAQERYKDRFYASCFASTVKYPLTVMQIGEHQGHWVIHLADCRPTVSLYHWKEGRDWNWETEVDVPWWQREFWLRGLLYGNPEDGYEGDPRPCDLWEHLVEQEAGE